jgi:hypothetical protein
MFKHTLLSIIAAATVSAAMAQPTLTAATNNPVAGDEFYGYWVDTNGLSMGPAGAGVTWDFSTIVRNDSDTTTFFNCAATPYCSSFPGSNIAFRNDGNYTYGVTSSTDFTILGAYADGAPMLYNNPLTLAKFPITMGTTFSDTSAISISVSGFDLYMTTRSTSVADAWGTLRLPTGTYTNALRVHTINIRKDSVDVPGMPFVQEAQTETYTWYAPGFHYSLLVLNYDTSGSGTPYISEAQYYRKNATTTSVRDAQINDAVLSLFPNPASDRATIRFYAAEAGTVTIMVTDVSGREVYADEHRKVVTGTNEAAVDISTLPNGVYTVRVAGSGVSAVSRLVVAH